MHETADTSEKLRVMAAALYEIRLLLGSMRTPSFENDEEPGVSLAANLAYTLHNHALDALGDGPDQDWSNIADQIEHAARLAGHAYDDPFGILTRRPKGS